MILYCGHLPHLVCWWSLRVAITTLQFLCDHSVLQHVEQFGNDAINIKTICKISPPYSNWITLTFSCIFIRHPWYNNSFAMSKYPRMAAKCKAVRPSYKWNKKNYKWIWIRQKLVISNIIILYVDIHASFNQIKYHTTKSTTSCIVYRSSRILLLCIIFYIRMSCEEKLMKMLFLISYTTAIWIIEIRIHAVI